MTSSHVHESINCCRNQANPDKIDTSRQREAVTPQSRKSQYQEQWQRNRSAPNEYSVRNGMRIIHNLPHGPVIPTHDAPREAEIVPEHKALRRCSRCPSSRDDCARASVIAVIYQPTQFAFHKSATLHFPRMAAL